MYIPIRRDLGQKKIWQALPRFRGALLILSVPQWATEVVTNEASLKLTADAEEADESNNVANKSNFSGPTTLLSMIIVLILTVLIV